jgi:hypothetical protein
METIGNRVVCGRAGREVPVLDLLPGSFIKIFHRAAFLWR